MKRWVFILLELPRLQQDPLMILIVMDSKAMVKAPINQYASLMGMPLVLGNRSR